MLKIGITGGIGTGKSTVSRIFSILGMPVYDADSRAKWLQNNDPELIEIIKSNFGNASYLNGKLDSQYLASQVFGDEVQLANLNSLVHPKVFTDSEAWYQKQHDVKYVLREAALLIESGMHKTVDRLIVVTSPLDLRIKRIRMRDPWRSEGEIEAIISRQLAESEKVKLADYVVVNDEDSMLIPQILELHKKFNA